MTSCRAPVDLAGPGSPSMRTVDFSRALGEDLSLRVATYARSQGATVFHVLLAAFGRMLHSETGQGDMVVGTTVSQRDVIRHRDRLGPLFNMLPLRIQSDRHTTFQDLVAHARTVCRGALQHGSVPFGDLVVELGIPCNRWGLPGLGLQVNFTFYGRGAPDGDWNPEESASDLLEPLPIEHRIREYDLYLFVSERGRGLEATLRHNESLIDRNTARAMLGSFVEVLARETGSSS